MRKLYVMMGLPGSGKSTYAKKIQKQDNNVVLLSADDLRGYTLGDVSRQDHNPLIFSMMKSMAVTALSANKDVIYDATNINEKRRKELAATIRKEVGEVYITGVYCLADMKTAYEANCRRARMVPYDAMLKMHKNFDVPTARDCYLDEIQLYSYAEILHNTRSSLESVLEVKTYQEYAEVMGANVNSFRLVRDMPQDCPYHTLSVSRHMYEAFKYAQKNMPEELQEYRAHILYALAFHDVGKGFCKEFHKPNSKYAHFIGHERASAQIFLKEASEHPCLAESANIDGQFIAALIKEHGYPYEEKGLEASQNALKEIEGIYGIGFMKCLRFMRECDQSAK